MPGTTHSIDGVDLWPSLSTGTTLPPRQWLPTTENSILWDTTAGKMWKLITAEKRSNRFHQNGSQYMDTMLPCLNQSAPGYHSAAKLTATGRPGRPADAWSVPNSCLVCSPEHPCLFDVRADPSETVNLAPEMSALAAQMAAKLASFVPYVPVLSAANLACYTCPGERPHLWWQNFSGPCCKPLNKTAGTAPQ